MKNDAEIIPISMEEIVVTPEMIEAGCMHLYRYHPDTGVGDEDTVTRIFRKMYLLSPSHASSVRRPKEEA